MKKITLFLPQIGLILGGVIAGIFLGELGLHLAGIQGLKKPTVSNASPIYRLDDPERGWSLHPGVSFQWKGEGDLPWIKANQEGLRDRDHEKKKPPKTYRIALLGDSFAESLQVPMENTFWWKMRKKLNKKCQNLGEYKVELINFGVQGYGTTQELMTLRHKVWEYSPDLVILAFFPGNDLINNSKSLEFHQRRPFFVYKNGELVPDLSWKKMSQEEHDFLGFSWVDYLPTWSVNNSRILQVLRKVDLEYKKRRLDEIEKTRAPNNYKEPIDLVWKEAWKITEELITMMNQEVKEKGADFMVLIVSTGLQVAPDPKSRQDHMKQFKIQNLDYPNQRIKALGERLNMRTLDTVPSLREYAEKNQICVHGFPHNGANCEGHWNLHGHEQVGELLAKHLCEHFLGDSPGRKTTLK